MGKASRKKREARADSPEARLASKRCLHCGDKKDTPAVWCDPCSLKGRNRAQFRAYPSYKPPFTEDKIENIKLLVRDRRWAWSIPVDLSYYEDSTPEQDREVGSA